MSARTCTDEDGVFVVEVPECISQETIEDAISNIKDAISGYVTSLKHDKPMPLAIDEETVEIHASFPVSARELLTVLCKIGHIADHQMGNHMILKSKDCHRV